METPKNKISLPSWFMVVIALLLVASIFCNVIQHYWTNKATADAKAKDTLLKTTITDLKYHIDSSGNHHVVFNPTQNTIKKELAQYSKQLDTIANKVGEKKNAITDYTKVSVNLQADNLKAKQSTDSIRKRPVSTYRDKTFDISYYPPFGSDTTGYFKPGVNLDLNYVNYRKRSWFLGALKSYTDIYSDDSRVNIRGVSRLVIEQPEPSFGLRVRASGTYSPELNSFSIGPEVALDFGRNQLSVIYYYNATAGQWRPTLQLKHDFIRF